jgi:hypothetical protein
MHDCVTRSTCIVCRSAALADQAYDGARHWIVLDGSIAPAWAEILHLAFADDNACLALPSGEVITLPRSTRVILETPDTQHASPATITRCGTSLTPITSTVYMRDFPQPPLFC